ncbi:hypothetical protein MKW98_011656 [Papaver atlanticum]|uniref:Uncharacterized protein n=1 Tax=Papaver atlanticum TaxID=357466 RepID=A0AAD4S7E9_9MAGN|nr:hypothetical protein MKW98_011656 [Papaver atlanticum]
MNPVNSSSSSSVTRSHHSLKRSLASKAFNLNNSPDAMPGKVRRSSRAHNNVKYTYDDLREPPRVAPTVVPGIPFSMGDQVDKSHCSQMML